MGHPQPSTVNMCLVSLHVEEGGGGGSKSSPYRRVDPMSWMHGCMTGFVNNIPSLHDHHKSTAYFCFLEFQELTHLPSCCGMYAHGTQSS